MKLVIIKDKSAPSCFILCQVDENGEWDTWDPKRTVLIQSDWDFPGIASNLGYVPCECGTTDGTVSCDHKTVGQMIEEANDFICSHLGQPFDDPGYFSEEI